MTYEEMWLSNLCPIHILSLSCRGASGWTALLRRRELRDPRMLRWFGHMQLPRTSQAKRARLEWPGGKQPRRDRWGRSHPNPAQITAVGSSSWRAQAASLTPRTCRRSGTNWKGRKRWEKIELLMEQIRRLLFGNTFQVTHESGKFGIHGRKTYPNDMCFIRPSGNFFTDHPPNLENIAAWKWKILLKSWKNLSRSSLKRTKKIEKLLRRTFTTVKGKPTR